VEVDDAIIGGFGWELGPFHILDALSNIIDKDQVATLFGTDLPGGGFYRNEGGRHYYFDYRSRKMEPLPRPSDVIVLKDLKKAGRTVEEQDSASAVDLGDGVLCVE